LAALSIPRSWIREAAFCRSTVFQEDDREAWNWGEMTAFLPAFRLSGQSLIARERLGR
jgi:hypothetical protein